jgi:hypothetical protein
LIVSEYARDGTRNISVTAVLSLYVGSLVLTAANGTFQYQWWRKAYALRLRYLFRVRPWACEYEYESGFLRTLSKNLKKRVFKRNVFAAVPAGIHLIACLNTLV